MNYCLNMFKNIKDDYMIIYYQQNIICEVIKCKLKLIPANNIAANNHKMKTLQIDQLILQQQTIKIETYVFIRIQIQFYDNINHKYPGTQHIKRIDIIITNDSILFNGNINNV